MKGPRKDMSLTKATLLALALAAPTQAVASPGIVECKFEDGSRSPVFKFSPTSWHRWDDKAWAWVEQICEKHPGVLAWSKTTIAPCRLSVNDDEYLWTQKGEYGDDLQHHFHEEILRIDRQNGNVSWALNSYVDTVGFSRNWKHQVSLKGACEAASDPSLQPKPKPKL